MHVCTIACTQAFTGRGGQNANITWLKRATAGPSKRRRRRRSSYAKLEIYIWICNQHCYVCMVSACVCAMSSVPRLVRSSLGLSFFLSLFSSRGSLTVRHPSIQKITACVGVWLCVCVCVYPIERVCLHVWACVCIHSFVKQYIYIYRELIFSVISFILKAILHFFTWNHTCQPSAGMYVFSYRRQPDPLRMLRLRL